MFEGVLPGWNDWTPKGSEFNAPIGRMLKLEWGRTMLNQKFVSFWESGTLKKPKGLNTMPGPHTSKSPDL
eukprot:3140655-Amphidinium_carterae.1